MVANNETSIFKELSPVAIDPAKSIFDGVKTPTGSIFKSKKVDMRITRKASVTILRGAARFNSSFADKLTGKPLFCDVFFDKAGKYGYGQNTLIFHFNDYVGVPVYHNKGAGVFNDRSMIIAIARLIEANIGCDISGKYDIKKGEFSKQGIWYINYLRRVL